MWDREDKLILKFVCVCGCTNVLKSSCMLFRYMMEKTHPLNDLQKEMEKALFDIVSCQPLHLSIH